MDKVKFATVEDAHHYKALVEYVAGAEFKELAMEAKKAWLAAQEPPPPPPPTAQPATPATGSPCNICDEPRGAVTPCPHCGME